MRRRGRWALPERLGTSVARELDRIAPGRESLAVAQRWEAAVGPTVARNAWPSRRMRDGTLVVHTSSSVWAHELSQMADAVLAGLGEHAPPRLKFVVGTVPEPAPLDPGGEGVRPPPAAGVPDEREGARLASAVADDDLRKAMAKAIAVSAAMRRSNRPV